MQGLVISIIYGFANEEVQNVLRTHWKRRMLVRMVKREGRERTVSLKVSVRDMGDIGEEGDHSNITQLTVTWGDLEIIFKFKIKVLHPKLGLIAVCCHVVRLKRRFFWIIFMIKYICVNHGRTGAKTIFSSKKDQLWCFQNMSKSWCQKVHLLCIIKYAHMYCICSNVYFKE